MQLYQRFLENNSIQTYVPSETVQKEYVTKAIYDIKSGKSLDDAEILLKKAIASLDSLPPQIIIMGCTEIPLALRKPIEGCVFINPTRILAGCAVGLCMNII
jgi:aspartate/glutamate racemase